MESKEISQQQAQIFRFLQQHPEWHTAKDVHAATGGSHRSTQNNLLRLVKLGIADQAEVHPGHRYRFSGHAHRRNLAYFQRLETVCEIFNL